MDTEIRIPTLLGLGVLLVGIVIGVLLVIQNQGLATKASSSSFPKDIVVSNITDTSVSISWQTEDPIIGFVQAGPQTALGLTFRDDRDTEQPQPHNIHFVTLTNLPAKSVFYYKVTSGSESYPETAQSFSTASETANQNYAPLIGTVLDVNSEPVQEALVTLSIDGAQTLSTVTKTSGNFILPLVSIRSADLSKGYLLDNTSAKLTVVSGNKISNGIVTLPFNGLLPAITLGKDFSISPPAPAVQVNKYDLNNDGQVNAADISVALSKKADQKEIDLISKEIERVSKK